MKTVTIYTDGACSGNPGPGGWGAILEWNGVEKELSGGAADTTNNRMELTGVIRALSCLKEPCVVELYSDSQYLVKNYNEGSVKRWKDKGWMRDRKNPAKNKDLWQQLLRLAEVHDVDFKWVEGHAGDKENERCDRLSGAAARRKGNPPDEVFENGENDIPLQAGLFG